MARTVYDANNYTGTLAASTAAGSTIDFVVQDNNSNRRVVGDLTFPSVREYTGTGWYTIEFAPGQVTRTIALTIKGDTPVEPNERFYVQLTGPTRRSAAPRVVYRSWSTTTTTRDG
jgi:hypothetical protein